MIRKPVPGEQAEATIADAPLREVVKGDPTLTDRVSHAILRLARFADQKFTGPMKQASVQWLATQWLLNVGDEAYGEAADIQQPLPNPGPRSVGAGIEDPDQRDDAFVAATARIEAERVTSGTVSRNISDTDLDGLQAGKEERIGDFWEELRIRLQRTADEIGVQIPDPANLSHDELHDLRIDLARMAQAKQFGLPLSTSLEDLHDESMRRNFAQLAEEVLEGVPDICKELKERFGITVGPDTDPEILTYASRVQKARAGKARAEASSRKAAAELAAV